MVSLGVEACVSQAMAADGTASAEVKRELGSYSLLTICKAMREYLCEVDKVQPAMRLLSAVAVDRSDLSTTDAQLLFTFFSEKLSQLENQTAALSCLALLVASIRPRYDCTEEWFRIIAHPFTSHVRVQQLPLNCRKQCFCIMNFIFTDATLPCCGSDTLSALLELLDGESDPELVIQTFDLHVIVATRASKEAFAPVLDDYFESISSYFPVVFSQPPGCRVTKSDLRTHLKRCLCLAVYSECCIPFMQGKLSSPSIAVKEDVIDALLTCFETYRHGTLSPFFPSLVAHMKNEVVKLSSFADRASSPTLTKCVFMGCEILGRISQSCGVKNQAEALELFGPVVEGFLAALFADTSVSSAYATMAFHVLTGSWNCCVFVSSYLFSMLAMSLSDAERPANAYILFAALVTGMLDALAAFEEDSHVESMRGSIERSTPAVAEAVRHCTALWGPPASSTSADDFTVVCGCEFVVAVLKLSRRLHPWLSADVIRDGVDALVWAALFRSPEVAMKVCKLLRDYAEGDSDGVSDALKRLLAATDVPAVAGLVVVGEMASSSPRALLLAYEEGFLSSACVWMTPIAPEEKARTFQNALDHFGGALRGSEADCMTAVLTRDDIPPAFLQCACFVARSLSGDACARLAAGDTSISQLGVAALLASRRDVHDVVMHWQAHMERLASLTMRAEAAWRRVGMEGVTGAVLNNADGSAAAMTLTPDARLLVTVAALWGRLLGDAGDDAGVRHLALVSAFAQECMGSDSAAETCADGSVVEAFTYLPFAAQHGASRPSLLHLLLCAGMSQSINSSASFCTAIRCLVESETDEQVRSCLAALLTVLNDLTQSHGVHKSALARSLLFSINAKCNGDPALARSVLFCDMSVRVLLNGASDTTLSTRQRSLQLLTSLARGAIAMAGNSTLEEKATLAGVRDRVLSVVKHALGDHKRRVRQAAGACGHEWHKVR